MQYAYDQVGSGYTSKKLDYQLILSFWKNRVPAYFFYSFATFFNCNFVKCIKEYKLHPLHIQCTTNLYFVFIMLFTLLKPPPEREKEYLHNILSFHFDGKNRVALHQNCKQGFDGSIMYRHTKYVLLLSYTKVKLISKLALIFFNLFPANI